MKKIILAVIIAVILATGGWYFFIRQPAPVQYEYAVAKRGDLIQEVSVTGKVKPAEAVDLAFEKSGKVTQVLADVGNKVKAGQILARIDDADIAAQLAQYEAALESARARLAELKRGTREEELRVAEAKVVNAKTALDDAKLNLVNTRQKADADLKEDYDGAFTAAVKAIGTATHALFVLTDIQNAHFSGYDQQSVGVADTKAAAVAALLGAYGAGRANNDYLSQLSGGAKAAVGSAQSYETNENTDSALSKLKDALQKLKSSLDAVPILSMFTSAESANLNTEKSNIAGELSTISSKQQAIEVQKITSQNAIAAAQASVNSVAGAFQSAQDELALKKAGAAPEAISAGEAQVKEAEAQRRAIQAQSAKTILRSPIDGVVTKQDVKTGEIVSANIALVSVISNTHFEIETNIPEADIAKIKIGDSARVTLDAYGDDVIFEAKVVMVDPAERVVEGVATYKTTLMFAKDDERVKSGMTANIDVATAKRENVTFIPRRATVRKDSGIFVFVPGGAGQQLAERGVKLGLVSSDGNVEVVEGLSEGDLIVSSPEKLSK